MIHCCVILDILMTRWIHLKHTHTHTSSLFLSLFLRVSCVFMFVECSRNLNFILIHIFTQKFLKERIQEKLICNLDDYDNDDSIPARARNGQISEIMRIILLLNTHTHTQKKGTIINNPI